MKVHTGKEKARSLRASPHTDLGGYFTLSTMALKAAMSV